jgi:hypothetical protein
LGQHGTFPGRPKIFLGAKIFFFFSLMMQFLFHLGKNVKAKLFPGGILVDSGWRVSYIQPQGRDFYGLSHSVTLWGFEVALPEIPPALLFLKEGEPFGIWWRISSTFSPFGKGKL